MKTITKIYNNIKISRFFTSKKSYNLDKVIRLEGEKSLSSVFSNYGWKLLLLSLKTVNKASSRLRLYHKLAKYLQVMTKRHGSAYTVMYLKASSLAISKALAGQPFSSLRETCPDLPLPRLTKTGLPVIIGTRDRQAILSNNPKVIRMYTTFFSLYRVINIKSELKLQTISDPFNGNPVVLEQFGGWLSKYTPSLIGKFKVPGWGYVGSDNFQFIESSSAAAKFSWTSLVSDASAIKSDPVIGPAFETYLRLSKSDGLERFFNKIVQLAPDADPSNEERIGCLGRLATKVEPAGKIRVFAIVDGWTQSLLKPLHERIFALLRKLPNDGTFDQGAAFDRAVQKSIKFNCCFGYDLSAATDRLPILLQEKILGSLIGVELAAAWKTLLIGRTYTLFVTKKQPIYAEKKYEVGQPMGALSSWAMLALTHHMIMQYCSYRLKSNINSWETRYEILGDDIVIFDASLAKEYLRIMSYIGVPINEGKSVVSIDRPVVEFAKRLAVNGQEVSALSWKQFISLDSFKGRISLAISLFLKDKSFRVKPMAVFNTVMKHRTWDKRIHFDAFAIFGALNSYLLDTKGVRTILQYVLMSKPHVYMSQMRFENLNMSLLTEMLVKHVKGEIPDKLSAGQEFSFLLALPPVKQLLVDKCEKLVKRMTIPWVRSKSMQVGRHCISDDHVLGIPEESKGPLTRLIGNHFISGSSFHKAGAAFAMPAKTLSLEALYEIYCHLVNSQSYFLLSDRLLEQKVVLSEIKVETSEILKWVAEVQRSSHNDFMYFDFDDIESVTY